VSKNCLAAPLKLPCGAVIPNRIAKAAMTEGLASPQGIPTPELERLYGFWSDGGAGLLLSGNIIVDGDHLERPGNVVIDSDADDIMLSALRRWATVATRGGNHFWAQISHAGRQTQKPVNPRPKAPSAVKVGLPGGQFGTPEPLTKAEIEGIVQGFTRCAAAVKTAGFTGVQIHAAHGYLLSQFLSPRTNLRNDEFGGCLENRARLLLEIVNNVRGAVGHSFPVSVKLNSADFQKGGFDFEESQHVVRWLEQASVDLVEISGGTYEQPRLLGVTGMEEAEEQELQESSRIREAYFVDFALAMQKTVSIPLMVTGGFRRRESMESALQQGGADLIGIGRPMCVVGDAPRQILEGRAELPRFEDSLAMWPSWLSFLNKSDALRTLGTFGIQFWYYAQLSQIGESGVPDASMGVFTATRKVMKHQKRWLAARKSGSPRF